MSFFLFGRRLLAVGLATWCIVNSPPSVEASNLSSLSGYVYLDYNSNGKYDSPDFAVRRAMVTLSRSDGGLSLSTPTDMNGYYLFDNLDTSFGGTFSITETQYTCRDGLDNLGMLYDAAGALVSDAARYGLAHAGANGVPKNSFTGITLLPGEAGRNYNFGEYSYPFELLSVQNTPTTNTPTDPPASVPEPATWAALLAGAAGLAIARLVRRTRRAATR